MIGISKNILLELTMAWCIIPEDIHIAFSVGSVEEVDRLTSEFREAGFEVLSGPRTTGDGYYESCIVGIEQNIDAQSPSSLGRG